VHAVVAQHRVGYLGIGGMAIFVAVAASHRGEAFEAASDLIERVKRELPIWKKQFLADGSHEWSQCP
jgi:molybdopterin synthase catalytic subunit